MSNSIVLSASIMVATLVATGALADNSGLEPPMDLLASQIRDQGFTCSKPQTATFDAERSRPNEKVWVLKCENDTFRMTVIPNMAARVEKISN